MAALKVVGKSILWAHLAAAAVTLLAYLSPSADPRNYWLISILGLFLPWLLLIQGLFFLLWIYLKRWYCLISLAVVLLGLPAIHRFISLGSGGDKEGDPSFSVMSYNLHYLQGMGAYSSKDYERTKENIVPFLKMQGPPTILCAQETHEKATRYLSKSLDYQYQAVNSGQITNTIFSKLPIRKSGEIKFNDSYNGGIWADLVIGKDTLRVFNLHLESNRVTDAAEAFMRPEEERPWWPDIKHMLRRYRNAARKRAEQARQISELLRQSPHRVLVCGDFNDSPQSFAYHILSEDLVDAFVDAGKGIGTTYGGIIPALKIDYILADPRLEVLDHRILKEKYSDHYPVISNIALTKSEAPE